MATVKEVISGFCYRLNLPSSSAYVGISKPAERQYLSLFESTGDDLRNRPHQWPQLKRSYTFNSLTGVRRYQLPGDFYRILDSTQWDITNKWPLRGAISDYEAAARQYSIISLQTRKTYRIIGPTQYLYSTSPYQKRSAGSFDIDPAGDNNTDQLFLGYISCNWIQPKDWITGVVYPAGSLVSGNGNVYRNASPGTSGTIRPTGDVSVSDGTLVWDVYREPHLLNVSGSLVGDDDLCVFDKDLMIDGMVWKYRQAKKQDFQQERADWENQVKNSFARFNCPSRINLAGDDYDDEWPNVPYGSWSV